MDRLFPLLAGFDRPAARGNPQFQLRGEVRGAGRTAHRVRPLQGSAQVADGDAHPRPADPGRAPEPDRVPGRHGVRLGGAAAQPAHARPSDYDLLALMRVMTEEMRHGWQMSYLLCSHFGDEGKREAAKLLERRADEGERLLGSFNELVDNWLDFFTYTQFIDRDGKFQLTMLSVSAFDPLSRSMSPMLKEESYHLGTGNNGLLRIVKVGKIPPEVMQRFFYKWIPTAVDLFGNDNSSPAPWASGWGLKGRYDERDNQVEPDKAKLNEYNRHPYRQEITKLIERLNMFIPERERWLRVPDTKFNRKIGVYAHPHFTVDGEPIDDA